MIKMIVSDLDGTLLRKDFSLPKRNVQAIKHIRQQGIVFLPASGRCFEEIHAIFQAVDLPCGAIELNGAQIRDEKGNVLFTQPIAKQMAEELLAIFLKQKLSLQIFTNQGVFAYPDVTRLQQDREAVISRNMGKKAEIQRLPLFVIEQLQQEKILKLETMSLDKEKLKQCQERLCSFSRLAISSSVAGNLEITAAKANKAFALETLLASSHIKKEEVVIFGDGKNDASLFMRFPNTIAVKNAHPLILTYASEITKECEQDGVGRWLETHLCR